jgi:hypothetical protein
MKNIVRNSLVNMKLFVPLQPATIKKRYLKGQNY